MPRTPAPLTVEFRAEHDGWLVLAPEGYQYGGRYIATFAEEADARAFVALSALMTALKEVLYIAERNEVLTNNRGGQSVGNSPTMQRSQAIELLKICRAALAQADGPLKADDGS
jgi:hypothetical protein